MNVHEDFVSIYCTVYVNFNNSSDFILTEIYFKFSELVLHENS